MVSGDEVCDDGDNEPGGCNPGCTAVESGWYCSGGSLYSPDVCVTRCGDGFRAGDEVCDDGDTLPGGCNPTCTGIEPGFY